MARQARQTSPTGYYHVMMRGNNREKIFKNEGQKKYFIELLKLMVLKEPIEIAAYCLMDNHVHIATKGELEDLSLAIKKTNIKYAMRFNKDTERIGHVFQDRYKSEIITDDKYLMMVIRYIHNNPVKAKIVTSPDDYRWSSYNEYANCKLNVITEGQKNFIMGYFSNEINLFKKFHLEDDRTEFLDTKEEVEANKLEIAHKIIAEYHSSKRLNETEQTSNKPENLEELIKILLKESTLSHRKIAKLLDISSNIVHKISLELKAVNK